MKSLYIIVFIPLFSLAQSDEECIYDQSTQTDEFIRDVPEFSNYIWNDKSKTATIYLPAGEILKAHRGGCVHFGITGTLSVPNSTKSPSDLDYWFKRCKWIAKRLFNAKDFETLVDSFNMRSYTDTDWVVNKESKYILIPHPTYNEFWVFIRYENDTTNLSVGYWY